MSAAVGDETAAGAAAAAAGGLVSKSGAACAGETPAGPSVASMRTGKRTPEQRVWSSPPSSSGGSGPAKTAP